MCKTTRWLRSLLGPKNKKSSDSPAVSTGSGFPPAKEKEKKKWGLIRSFNINDTNNGGTRASFAEPSSYVESVDANKHAIAVAAATAAVAEAALAAAQAAAEVVRLTTGGSRVATAYVSSCSDRRRELAAVKIQSAFRAYLARRALSALKGLVKLQALVRGHIVRKQSADMLKRMQAMVRIQARACANRAYESSHSSSRSSQSHHPGLAPPKIYDHRLRACNTKLDGSGLKRCGSKSNIKDSVSQGRAHLGSNWFDCWMEENSWNSHRDTLLKNGSNDDEKSDKILEIDTWKPHLNPKRSGKAFQTSQHVSAWNHNELSFTPFDSLSRQTKKSQNQNTVPSSGKFLSFRSLKFPQELDQAAVRTAENSPRMHSASSRPGSSSRRCPFTPARSECSRSVLGDYLSYPNYMANTEASRAKFRSQSAPRQRMQFEKPGSTKRFVRGFWDAETNSEKGSSLHANFSSKAYSGSGHLGNSNLTSSTSRATLFERK